jgi:hypothetical protein
VRACSLVAFVEVDSEHEDFESLTVVQRQQLRMRRPAEVGTAWARRTADARTAPTDLEQGRSACAGGGKG